MGVFGSAVLVAGFALLAGPCAGQEQGRVAISNLKAGVVCGMGSLRRVCFQTQTVYITGEGSCVYNKEMRPCTWYGYSFDYQVSKEKVLLQCSVTTSTVSNFGNPGGEQAKNTFSGQYEVELTAKDHSYFHPQYMVLPPYDAETPKVDHMKQQCSYQGQKVFEVVFDLLFPEK